MVKVQVKASKSRLIIFYSQKLTKSKSKIQPFHFKDQSQALLLLLQQIKSMQFVMVKICSINFTLLVIQISLIISEQSRITHMIINNPQTTNLIFYKIHFVIKKKVKFGQAIFVCGNISELGLWQPPKAYRLKWNQGDIWSGSLLFAKKAPQNIEYKYIITDWHHPISENTQWQIGTHNRQIDLISPKITVICDDKWNMDKISLNLIVNKGKNISQTSYYVIGDIAQLGNWQQKKQMKKINKKYPSLSKKQNYTNQLLEKDIYTYTFHAYRNKEYFEYYYLKKNSVVRTERKPYRSLHFNNQKSIQPYRIKVTHAKGQICIVDYFSINQLNFSEITENLFVGSYPKSILDIQKLKQKNITAIFSIQSQKDFNRHGLSPHYLNLLCLQNGIKYKKYSILDMNNDDFISKASGGLKILYDLIKQGEKVYVHCTAGIYRSPQMIAIYLTLYEKYTIEQAMVKIKQNHPFAKPNYKVIKDAISIINPHRLYCH